MKSSAPNPSFTGYISIIVAAVIWGVNGTMVQYLISVKDINIEWLVTVRLLLPGLLLIGIPLLFGKHGQVFRIWKTKKDVWALVAFSGGLAAVQYTFFAAIKASNAATATILQFSAPVMISLYYAVRYLKRPSRKELAAVVLATIGTLLLATKGEISQIKISSAAIFWGLVSAVALAFYSIQPRRLLQQYPSTVVVGWGMLLGAFFFSFVHVPWKISGQWDRYTAAYFAFIILLGSLLAFSLYLQSVKLIGAYIAALLVSIEPFTATIISIWWLKVPFGWAEVLGAMCILSTVFMLTRKK